jgi:hypothetical protein
MPTAGEFRAAAARLQAAADDCDSMSSRMWSIGGNHGVRGGTLEALVETSLTANALGSDTLARQCNELADLCLERAVVCDDYADQLVRWARSVDAWEVRRDDWANRDTADSGLRSPGPRPPRPVPPASWVEVG